MSLLGLRGRPYILEAATNLSPPILWQAIATNRTTNGVVEFLDTTATNYPHRFYRALTP